MKFGYLLYIVDEILASYTGIISQAFFLRGKNMKEHTFPAWYLSGSHFLFFFLLGDGYLDILGMFAAWKMNGWNPRMEVGFR